MRVFTRRYALAGVTLAVALAPRKPMAARLGGLADRLQATDPPVAAPDIGFTGAEGKTHSLSEFRGHGMVINFWATWCAPCVAEMPSLADLSRALAPHDIAVLPLSSDRGGAATVSAWFSQHEVSGLPVLLDPKGQAARLFETRGIPTSVIIDRQGRERGRVEGSVDWSTPQAAEAIQRLIDA